MPDGGLIYGKILHVIRAVLEFRMRNAGASGKREIMVDVAINK